MEEASRRRKQNDNFHLNLYLRLLQWILCVTILPALVVRLKNNSRVDLITITGWRTTLPASSRGSTLPHDHMLSLPSSPVYAGHHLRKSQLHHQPRRLALSRPSTTLANMPGGVGGVTKRKEDPAKAWSPAGNCWWETEVATDRGSKIDQNTVYTEYMRDNRCCWVGAETRTNGSAAGQSNTTF
ncbi:uncharacterized protein LY79DRAFT_154584 [Colletotrichum navitas]|uniref:Uncharacterized protein n=1 Tax=Colletotrichum navitas TaxID=681940 RepID=A0AAD8V631_9PEZI|nr:uncharacterized protein LY79DRAFT_154584 [Colletotrichum navitas]KAK1594364.1 hypothetical protein LY79DRAFT_154584 [Colletotrichum navitas]